ncbi:MAG: carboxypeptidase regulatory-like domain-containing protein [Longimicrobiales bacterium]
MIQLARLGLPLLLTGLLLPAFAQAQTATIQGRVQDAVTGSPIINATIMIERRGSTITDREGNFRFLDVPLGGHQLLLQALGYSPRTVGISLQRDTVLVIGLSPRPVQIDSLRVVSRWVNVRGRLTERTSGRPVTDGAVHASQQRPTRSNVDGRFHFRRVPAGVPFEVNVLAFSYQPVHVSLVPDKDTTLTFDLVPDSFVLRLIDQQLARLEARMVQSQGEEFALTRQALARFDGGSLGDAFSQLIQFGPYPRVGPAACFFLDEKEFPGNPMGFLIPQEVERVEVLHNGATVRVYTRRFMARMTSGDVTLKQTGISRPPRGFQGRPGSSLCH